MSQKTKCDCGADVHREHGSDFFTDFQLMEDYEVIRDLVERTDSEPEPEDVFNLKDRINRLWQCPNLQEAYKTRSRFQLIDSAKHFLDQVSFYSNNQHHPFIALLDSLVSGW